MTKEVAFLVCEDLILPVEPRVEKMCELRSIVISFIDLAEPDKIRTPFLAVHPLNATLSVWKKNDDCWDHLHDKVISDLVFKERVGHGFEIGADTNLKQLTKMEFSCSDWHITEAHRPPLFNLNLRDDQTRKILLCSQPGSSFARLPNRLDIKKSDYDCLLEPIFESDIKTFAKDPRFGYVNIRPFLEPYVFHDNRRVRELTLTCLRSVVETDGHVAFREQQHVLLRHLGGFSHSHIEYIMKAVAKGRWEILESAELFFQANTGIGWKECDIKSLWSAIISTYCLSRQQAITRILRDKECIKDELLPDSQFYASVLKSVDAYKKDVADAINLAYVQPRRSAEIELTPVEKEIQEGKFDKDQITTPWAALCEMARAHGKINALSYASIDLDHTWEELMKAPGILAYCTDNPEVVRAAAMLLGRFVKKEANLEESIQEAIKLFEPPAAVKDSYLKLPDKPFKVTILEHNHKPDYIGQVHHIARHRGYAALPGTLREKICTTEAMKIQEIKQPYLSESAKEALLAQQELTAKDAEWGIDSREPVRNPACFLVLDEDYPCEIKDNMLDMTFELKVPAGITLENEVNIEVWKGELNKDEDGEQMDWTYTMTYRYHGVSKAGENLYRYTRLEELQPAYHMEITCAGPLTVDHINSATADLFKES